MNGSALAGHGAEAVRDAITATIIELPEHFRWLLAPHQAAKVAQHVRLLVENGLDIYSPVREARGRAGETSTPTAFWANTFSMRQTSAFMAPDELSAIPHALRARLRKKLG